MDFLVRHTTLNWWTVEFKTWSLLVLVATDIAARRIDIIELSHIVNFNLPSVTGDFAHRIGRTGRNGRRCSITSVRG